MNTIDVALICKALGDTNRLQIVQMLVDGEKCACKLLEQFEITQPTLSHHMKILCVDWWICGKKVNGAITHSIAIRWRHLSILLIIFPALKRMGGAANDLGFYSKSNSRYDVAQ